MIPKTQNPKVKYLVTKTTTVSSVIEWSSLRMQTTITASYSNQMELTAWLHSTAVSTSVLQ